jgi:hypothetical protein
LEKVDKIQFIEYIDYIGLWSLFGGLVMKSKVKAFVEFRFDHLIKKDILNSYIIILLFNILLSFLSKGMGDQILFGAMLFFFIFLSSRVLSRVKKFMMRTYLYKGMVSIYLNILFTVTFYYVIRIGQLHDLNILFFLFLIVLYFNVVSYILAKYYVKKGRYTKEETTKNYKLNFKTVLLLSLVIIAIRLVITRYVYFSFTFSSLAIIYFIALVVTFYLMFRFNSFNLQLLKAYYINKFNLEKDEFNKVDLADRLSRC